MMHVDQVRGVSAAGLMCLPAIEQIAVATNIMSGLSQNSPEAVLRAVDFAVLNNFRIPGVFQQTAADYDYTVVAPVFAYFAGARLAPAFQRDFNATSDVRRKSMLAATALEAYEKGIFKYHQVEAAYQILKLEADEQLRQHPIPKPPMKPYSPTSLALRTLAYGGAGFAAFVGLDLGTAWFVIPAGVALAAEVPLGLCANCEGRNYEMALSDYRRATTHLESAVHAADLAFGRLADAEKNKPADVFPTPDRWEFREAYFDSIGFSVRVMKAPEDFYQGPNYNLKYAVISLPEGEAEIRFAGSEVVHDRMVLAQRGESLIGSGIATIDRVDRIVKLDNKGDGELVLSTFVKALNGEFKVKIK